MPTSTFAKTSSRRTSVSAERPLVDALRDYTDRAYGYLLDALRASTPSQLLKQSSVYNLPAQSASRWLMLSYEHAVWTLGQTVPYLRLNGVTPPGYKQPL